MTSPRLLVLFSLLAPVAASAQTETTAAPDPTPAVADKISALEQRIATLESESEQAASEGEGTEEKTLSLYGFLDTGLQRLIVDPAASINGIYPTRETTFVLGKANVYLDARPAPHWRTLIETRFTLYPNGAESFSPTYQRTDTRGFDSNEPSGRSKVAWGGVVMERAWGEWTHSQLLTIQAGLFPAPYGIWNIDHGTPVLISLLLPAFQIEEAIPSRLVGVHAYGNQVMGAYDLGYHLYVSNGRTASNVDLTDDKAIGARLFLRHSGDSRWTVGTSGYWGTTSDESKTLDFSSGTFGVKARQVWARREWVVGLDLAVDHRAFRFRTEGLLRHVQYDDGLQAEPASGPPGAVQANRYHHYWYGLLAYRFARKFEPYAYVEIKYASPSETYSDFNYTPSLGFNIYFTPWAQLKTQYAAAFFHNLDGRPDPQHLTIRYVTSRLVFVF